MKLASTLYSIFGFRIFEFRSFNIYLVIEGRGTIYLRQVLQPVP